MPRHDDICSNAQHGCTGVARYYDLGERRICEDCAEVDRCEECCMPAHLGHYADCSHEWEDLTDEGSVALRDALDQVERYRDEVAPLRDYIGLQSAQAVLRALLAERRWNLRRARQEVAS